MPQNHAPKAPTRPLRLVADGGAHATATTAERARARPPLAVWPLEYDDMRSLPRELACGVIANYSEPGELVLAAASAREALRAAPKLNRRILPLTTRARTSSPAAGVTRLPANAPADLAIAAVGARRAAHAAARLQERLKPGAFLVLALDGTHGPLGAIVRACQKQGLQYWQHIVAIDTRQLAGEGAAGGARNDSVRSIRCHRDLLVFRRPAQADAVASAEAAA